MEIRQLEYFLMVSQVNSFTRAAERLFVSQPAVTNAVRNLEEELGIQLFDRNQKQALLTVEGQIFCRHVTELMAGISNTITEINALKNLNSGVLNIGLTPLGGIKPIASLLKLFHESFPNIKVSFLEADTEALIKALLAEEIDIALTSGSQPTGAIEEIPLPRQELMVCCSKRHRLRRRNVVPASDLKGEPLLLFSPGYKTRQLIDEYFAAHKLIPQVSFESSHVQTIKSLVANDTGITLLPESLLESDDNLVAIGLEEELFLVPQLCYKGNHHLSHAAEAFLDLGRQEAEQK